MHDCDVVIMGAGPYGLSAAAYLKAIPGLDVIAFGKIMSFWEHHMPKGILLRSPWAASHLADPEGEFNLDAYWSSDGNHFSEPIPLKDFVQYGRWFQERAALPVHDRNVVCVDFNPGAYQVGLENGETVRARRVIVACGIQAFVHKPRQFQGLPEGFVSHTSDHTDLGMLRGKKVLVIGGGQSALESAALLHEAGTHVEVLVREPVVHWTWQRPWMHSRSVRWMFYGKADVGPAGVSLLAQRPGLFRRLPRRIQDRWGVRSIRPAGTRWLKPRTREIPIHVNRHVLKSELIQNRVSVHLSDGTVGEYDHILLGTGYQVDITRYSFLSPRILQLVKRVNGYPLLNTGFETSLPGLHFLGAPAAFSFGPLMRFVAGAEFACPALYRWILNRKRT